MRLRRIGGVALSLALLTAVSLGAVARAETAAPAQSQPQSLPPQDFSGAQFVYVSLGETSDEQGLRLIDGQLDGLTEALPGGGRRSLVNTVGSSRYMYFDVHDSYIRGGFNRVIMTIQYEDTGLAPIDLEYDAYDVVNPESREEAWVKKRINAAMRTNTGSLRSARIVIDDARFAGNQPGGADFRLVTNDSLVVRSISLMRSYGPNDLPVRVVVDGKEVIFDVKPFINPQTNLTLVPMRKLFNALGVPDQAIVWDNAQRTVTAQKGQTTIILRIDSDQAVVRSQAATEQRVTLSQPAIIKDGRTLIPLRFVSENLGLQVNWNPDTHLITITSR